MRNWIEKLTPKTPMGQRLLMLAVVIGVGVGAFLYGRRQHANAQGRGNGPVDEITLNSRGSNNGRVVAYMYGNMPVSREELGEYLIARFGAERLEFMINRKIVEIECAKHKITASDAEVEERFQQDLRSFGKMALTSKDFENNILRRFNKTLFEWKEDVIRPKIMMEKLVREQVRPTDQDVKDGFEARFGPKVQCRIIVLQQDSIMVQKVWEDVRKSRDEFLKVAAKQFVPNLAQSVGEVPPIHKHFGDKQMEAMAFRLREGEISEPLKLQDGTFVIMLCEKHLPANIGVKYEQVWMQIHKEVHDLKIAQKMPEVFAKLQQQAAPKLLLDNAVVHVTRLEQPTGTTLSTIENSLSTRPLPPPENVPPPKVTPVTAPGVNPGSVPNTPPQPLNVVPDYSKLPKFDPPPGTKK